MVLPPVESSAAGVFVDTLSFTLSLKSLSLREDASPLVIKKAIDSFFDHLDIGLTCSPAHGYGGRFYKNSADIVYRNDLEVHGLGKVYFDGNKDTVNFLFNGMVCDYLNIHNFIKPLHEILLQYKAKITRLDLALDFQKGEYDHFDIRNWHESGQFNTGGRTPKIGAIYSEGLDLIEAKGRTIYVGSRQSTKYFRCYDKGYEQGDPSSKWIRFEIEYKANNGSVLPLDMLIETADYFFGAYEAFDNIREEFNASMNPKKIKSMVKDKVTLTIDELTEYMSVAYGRLLNTMSGMGLTSDQILQRVSRCGLPSRLIVPDLAPTLLFQDDDTLPENCF